MANSGGVAVASAYGTLATRVAFRGLPTNLLSPTFEFVGDLLVAFRLRSLGGRR